MNYKGGRTVIAFLLWVLLLWPALSSFADKAWAGEPTDRIRQTVEDVRKVFRNKQLDEDKRIHRLREIAGKVFDYREMAKRSLGLYWRKRSSDEKKDFVSLYSRFIVDIYAKKIRANEAGLEKHKQDRVRYIDEDISDSYASVKTVVITYQDSEIPVEYRMINTKGQWMIYDVIVSGVSLINNYRTQFYQVIRDGSYEELVKKLKAKTR